MSVFFVLCLAVKLVGPGITIEIRDTPIETIPTYLDGTDIRADAAHANDEGYYRYLRDNQDLAQWNAIRITVDSEEIVWRSNWILTAESEFNEVYEISADDLVLAARCYNTPGVVPFSSCLPLILKQDHPVSTSILEWGDTENINGAVRLPIEFGKVRKLQLEVTR